jgi:hypothetical protein
LHRASGGDAGENCLARAARAGIHEAQVSFPIAGAERTVLAPIFIREDEEVYPKKEEFAALADDWPALQRLAAPAARRSC